MLQGSMVALITPMLDSGEIDFPALRRLVDWHIASGSDAIVVLGSTGEAATLSLKEREQVISETVKQVNNRIPVIAGTGTHCTAQSLDLTQQAAELGATASLVVTPYYNRPTQRGLIAHYETLLDAQFPLILYNVPSRTAVDMLPETVLALSKHELIWGIKESSTLERIFVLLKSLPKRFAVISGDDINALEGVKAGAVGVISVAANLYPHSIRSLMAAALQKDWISAQKINERLAPLLPGLFVETNPIPVKWALHHLGKIEAGIRLPLQPLHVQYRDALVASLIDE